MRADKVSKDQVRTVPVKKGMERVNGDRERQSTGEQRRLSAEIIGD